MPLVTNRPVLVGERNSKTGDARLALYPEPANGSGGRLMEILGLGRRAYLTLFDRVNLCGTEWDLPAAGVSAAGLRSRRLVLLGSRVCQAFGVPFEPFAVLDVDLRAVVLPHPSGRCRVWNDLRSAARARRAVGLLVPELHLEKSKRSPKRAPSAEELANDPSLRWNEYRWWEVLWSDGHGDPVRFERREAGGVRLSSLDGIVPLGLADPLSVRRPSQVGAEVVR